MVVLGSSNAIMYECRVLYIGSAPPIDTLKGTEALQEPLRQRYPTNVDQIEGIDATIRVLPIALQVTYNESGQVVMFPLDRLTICAGVRAVTLIDGTTGEQTRQFVPVNTVQQDNKHPAIFAAIIRRNKGRQIAECHAFICNNTRDALHLVNATATANMALKEQRDVQVQQDSNSYQNGVAVVHASVINDHGTMNGTNAREIRPQSVSHSKNEIYISTTSNQLDGQHYKADTPKVESLEPETIYITFDKSNLKPTGPDSYEGRSRSTYTERRFVQEMPPSPRPVRYNVFPGGPAPPPPPPMIFAGPPPPRPPMFVRPPPPQRLYTRRVISPPPPMRFVAPAPVFVRSRARSASPHGHRYAASELKYSSKGQYQPKWSGKPASDSGFRSRRDHFERYPGPRENMFINERAFSRRMNADQRFGGPMPAPGYIYPAPYGFGGDAGFYDRPTTKSNPRYSSSESSDDERRPRRSTNR